MQSTRIYKEVDPILGTQYGKEYYGSKVGRETNLSGYGEKTYAIYMRPLSGWTDYANHPSYVTVTDFEIHLTITGTEGTVAVCAMESASDDIDSIISGELFNKIASETAIGTYVAGNTYAIQITDEDTRRKIMANGIGIRPESSGKWMVETEVEISYEYSNPQEQPFITASGASMAYLSDSYAITWSYVQSGGTPQESFDAEYINTESGETLTLASGESMAEHGKTFLLPSFNLTPGEGTIRIRVRTQYAESAWSEIPLALKSVAVDAVSPDGGENRLASSAIRLMWAKASDDTSTGEPHAFDIAYSTNGGETWTALLTKGSADKSDGKWYCDIPADTLPHGPVRWRVRAWSSAYYAGEYDTGMFQSVVQASTSSVSCDGKPHPTLSWTSSAQTAYQVRFGDYDSGAVYGAETSHTVPYLYRDGLYAVQVRTQAANGAWSAWTDKQYVTIANTPQSGSVSIKAAKSRHMVTLSWTATGSFSGYILYRGETPVYAGTDNTFADAEANGIQTYTVRAVTAGGYYAESAALTVNCTPETDCIRLADGSEWIPLRYSPEKRTRQYTKQTDVTYMHFAGRPLPVAFTEGFETYTATMRYIFRDAETARILRDLSGKDVIWKGTDGETVRGVMGDVSHTNSKANDIAFQITATDRKEDAKYAV